MLRSLSSSAQHCRVLSSAGASCSSLGPGWGGMHTSLVRQVAPCRSTRRCRVIRTLRVRAASIGFDLGAGDKAIERTAFELTTAAASLLLYVPVMQTKPGQALLKLLLYLQKGSATQLLETYAELYSALLAAGSTSWQDFVLDQILLAPNNAYAKSCARGEVVGGEQLEAAAGYDLDVLQQLALSEATLVGWIKEVARSVPDVWMAPVLGRRRDVPGDEDGGESDGAGVVVGRSVVPEGDALNLLPQFILGPLSDGEREAWRAYIGGRWKWSEAVPALRYYYSSRGCALLSQHSCLTYVGGAFRGFDAKVAEEHPVRARLGDTSVYAMQRAALWSNLERHLRGLPASHVLALGDGRSMQSYFVWDAALGAGAEAGLRLVKLPAKEVEQLTDLGRALGDHPRMRFIVVIDPLEVTRGSAQYAAVLSTLAGFGQSGWPDNALLVVSAYTGGAALEEALVEVSRFPSLRLQFGGLSEAEYLSVVSELMHISDPNGSPVVTPALQYGYQQGFALRSAYEYALESYVQQLAKMQAGEQDDQGSADEASDE